MQDNQQPLLEAHVQSRKGKRIVGYIFLSLLIVAVGFALAWQQLTIMNLSTQVGSLEKSQLPTKQFENYDDCLNNGGVDLFTIGGQFSACMGGKMDDQAEIPSYQTFLQYSAQNLPRINEHKISKTDNRVDGADKASADLVSFLKEDYSGCEIGSADGKGQGYYKVVKELPNRFALLNYGCVDNGQDALDHTFMIAMKLGNGWSLLSPTNNMDENGVPSCLLVDMFKISKSLTPKCFENTGYGDGNLRDVTYL